MEREIKARYIRRDGFIKEEVVPKIEMVVSFADIPKLEVKISTDTNPSGVTIKKRGFLLKRQYIVAEYEEM